MAGRRFWAGWHRLHPHQRHSDGSWCRLPCLEPKNIHFYTGQTTLVSLVQFTVCHCKCLIYTVRKAPLRYYIPSQKFFFCLWDDLLTGRDNNLSWHCQAFTVKCPPKKKHKKKKKEKKRKVLRWPPMCFSHLKYFCFHVLNWQEFLTCGKNYVLAHVQALSLWYCSC